MEIYNEHFVYDCKFLGRTEGQTKQGKPMTIAEFKVNSPLAKYSLKKYFFGANFLDILLDNDPDFEDCKCTVIKNDRGYWEINKLLPLSYEPEITRETEVTSPPATGGATSSSFDYGADGPDIGDVVDAIPF